MALPNHRCPKCRRPVAIDRLWVPGRAAVWARWSCPGCKARLRFDASRRFAIGLFCLPYVSGLARLIEANRLSWFLFLPGLIPVLVALHYFDRIKLADGLRFKDRSRTLVGEAVRKTARAEGREDGRKAVLLRQLRKRFGALPVDVEARVSAADIEALDLWAERILSARTLDDMFT